MFIREFQTNLARNNFAQLPIIRMSELRKDMWIYLTKIMKYPQSNSFAIFLFISVLSRIFGNSSSKLPIVYVYTVVPRVCHLGLPQYIKESLQQAIFSQPDCNVILARYRYNNKLRHLKFMDNFYLAILLIVK